MAFPQNEEETIALFKLVQYQLGWRIIHLQTRFPDAVIENGDGQRLVAEFEYLSKNFKDHEHNPGGCDLIVCWKDNWENPSVPVWPLVDCAKKEVQIIQGLLGHSVSWYDFIEERAKRIAVEKTLREIRIKTDNEQNVDELQNGWLGLLEEWDRAPFPAKMVLAWIAVIMVHCFLGLLRIILS